MARLLSATFLLLVLSSPASALTLAGFGDSITCTTCNDGSYMSLLADYMEPDPIIDDNGISADLTSNVLTRLEAWIAGGNTADWVIILTGTPDTYTTLGGFGNQDYNEAQTVQNVSDMLDAVFAAGMSALLVAPPPVQDPCGGPGPLTCGDIFTRLEGLSLAYASLATTQGVPFVDLFSLFMADSRWANPPSSLDSLFLNDGLHPRFATGDVLIAQAIASALVPEPSAAALLGLGLVAVAAARRRRR